jgi:hypothetical protein
LTKAPLPTCQSCHTCMISVEMAPAARTELVADCTSCSFLFCGHVFLLWPTAAQSRRHKQRASGHGRWFRQRRAEGDGQGGAFPSSRADTAGRRRAGFAELTRQKTQSDERDGQKMSAITAIELFRVSQILRYRFPDAPCITKQRPSTRVPPPPGAPPLIWIHG